MLLSDFLQLSLFISLPISLVFCCYQQVYDISLSILVSDIAVFVLKRDAKLQPTNQLSSLFRRELLVLLTRNFCFSSDHSNLTLTCLSTPTDGDANGN